MSPQSHPNRSSLNQIDCKLDQLHNAGIIISSREIFLHSDFDTSNDDEPGVDYRMAVTLEKNLRFLQTIDEKPILIHQHCTGGNWNDGMAIYDTIKSSQSFITILVYAQASSMSSVILQAADLRILMPNVEVLVHYGDNILHGTGEQVLSGSKRIAEINDILLDIYAEKCQNSEIFKGKTKDEIKAFLDKKLKQRGDWYLNPEDAVKYGFADDILGSSKYRKINDLLLS